MEFEFTCGKTKKIFKSLNFNLINNKGIKKNSAGQNYLDAEIILTDPCPFCGEKHSYHVNELSCPFNG